MSGKFKNNWNIMRAIIANIGNKTRVIFKKALKMNLKNDLF